MQTLNTLLPYLQFLAGSGSGWLASWLFDQLRDEILPLPTYPEWAARLLNVAVYRPLGARVTVFAFTALIAFGASIAVAFITGQPVLDVTDASIASLVAIVLGQVRHGVKTFPATIDVDLEGDHDERSTNTRADRLD
jgi:hypothetical protein